MDQIFDRLGRLIKSWADLEDPFSGTERKTGSGGDSDLDAAMRELDDFLDTSRTETERRDQERERREREERERAAREQARAKASSGQGGPRPDPRAKLDAAYRDLGLAPGTAFPQVKAAYKKLLMQHHPDRHAGDPARQKQATATAARINAAYLIIETWTSTGKLPED